MPYRHDDDEIVDKRLKLGREICAHYLSEGKDVKCPVVAFHETIQQVDSITDDYEEWKQMVEKMIILSEKVVVLQLPEWEQSEGVEDEIRIAKKHNREIEYLNPNDID